MADGIPLLLLKAEDKNCWSMILHHANGRTTTLPCATPAEHLIAASEIDYRPYRREIQKLREQHPFFEARFEAVIFVNGCFWHGHTGCRYFVWPKNNSEFWREKIIGNIARDQKNYELLRELGWHVFVIWECELKRSVMEKTLDSLINNIKQGLQSATNL